MATARRSPRAHEVLDGDAVEASLDGRERSASAASRHVVLRRRSAFARGARTTGPFDRAEHVAEANLVRRGARA